MLGIPLVSVTFLAYFVFYSAYDKRLKKLNFDLLAHIFSFRRPEHSFKEINKVIALVGITILMLAILIQSLTYELLVAAAVLLGIHFLYSSLVFYVSGDYCKSKLVGIVVGIVSLSLLWAIILVNEASFALYRYALLTISVLGSLHFILVESNSKWVLQIRPFAYLPLLLLVACIINFIVSYNFMVVLLQKLLVL